MAEFTVGVEEEYQLIHPETGEFASRARDVIATDWAGEIATEIQETMVEVGTPICRSTETIEREIRRLRFHVATAAAANDLTVAVAGLHPFSRWEDQSPTESERYARVRALYGRIMRTEHVFGTHVHVAVPEGTDRMVVINRIRPFLPYLLALTASSPLYEGEDTGYASYRTVLVRRFPTMGPPPDFDSEAEYWRYAETLARSGAVVDAASLYWSVRPHASYPTVEFRGMDACPDARCAAAAAALGRALVAAAAEDRLPAAGSEGVPAAGAPFDASHEWLSARFGLDAVLAGMDGAERLTIRDGLRRLLDPLAPVFEELGDGAALALIEAELGRKSMPEHIRGLLAACGDLREVMLAVSRESLNGTGLDPLSYFREECA